MVSKVEIDYKNVKKYSCSCNECSKKLSFINHPDNNSIVFAISIRDEFFIDCGIKKSEIPDLIEELKKLFIQK